ncbi:hypothetical protein [Roseateles sp.]|uniref:hypothetical protein n=1 Tax=Roseateles sp. TaxID=1971397 RepID=UPI00286B7782|nr:hypothetical protein [Roseateles sp.]
MNWLNKLPGFQRSPPGLEWAIWQRLPRILWVGTVIPGLLALACWWAVPEQLTSAADRDLLLTSYRLMGLVMLHWTLVLTVGIGCVLVMVMKGPAYVADAYPPPGREDAPPSVDPESPTRCHPSKPPR